MKNKIFIIIYMIILIFIIQVIAPIGVKANGIFDENITFSTSYTPGSGEVMPYGLVTPSTANTSSSVPLIVWLHGSGEFGGGEALCMGEYNSNLLPRVLMDSSLEKFNAYVLIPHSTGSWNYGSWTTNKVLENVDILIQEFVKEKKNIDTNNIIISGHSLGGIGALYMAVNMEQMHYKFSKLVIVSGYPYSGADYSKVTIPTRGYFGSGEGSAYMDQITTIDKIVNVGTSHASAPGGMYTLDEDSNNKSDVIEWMFKDVVITPAITGIKLDKTAISLVEGKKSALKVLAQPDTADLSGQIITWESANPSVATIDSTGTVTAVGAGNTQITATVLGHSAICNVTVTEQLKVDLSETEITIPSEQIKHLKITLNESLDNKTIQWSSSNKAVATVNQKGVVTAIGEGVTDITVTVRKQETTGEEVVVSKTCRVNVLGQIGDVDKDKK